MNATYARLFTGFLAHEPPKAVEQSRRTKADGGGRERDENEIQRCGTLASMSMN
jgi:hypothetical protein